MCVCVYIYKIIAYANSALNILKMHEKKYCISHPLLLFLVFILFLLTEFPYASPGTEILEIKITRCSCSSSILGHARDLSRI
jgi:hypothetical protein